jgi:hypothetical protein
MPSAEAKAAALALLGKAVLPYISLPALRVKAATISTWSMRPAIRASKKSLLSRAGCRLPGDRVWDRCRRRATVQPGPPANCN